MADTNEVRAGSIWFCKIGEHSPLQLGADSPMRDAVAAEYKKLTGCEPKFIFSGWGGELTEGERAVVENREPVLEATPPADAAHPDDVAVDHFAAAMKAKMAASRAKGRGGWESTDVCQPGVLQGMLVDHLSKGDPVDVGNFAMMLFNRGERTTQAVPDGMALVPVEPTVEILRAAWRAHGYEDGDLITDDFDPRVIYRAMLAASKGEEPSG